MTRGSDTERGTSRGRWDVGSSGVGTHPGSEVSGVTGVVGILVFALRSHPVKRTRRYCLRVSGPPTLLSANKGC